MKKIILLIIAISFIVNSTKGQIIKGNWMIGGNISYSSTTYKSEALANNTGYVLKIEPDIGYFLADKFVVGLKADISKQGSKATGTSVFSSYTDFNIGPFFRYYFLPSENIINIIVEGAYLYGFEGGSTTGRGGQKTSKNTFSLAAGPVVYFNSAVGLEFLIGYSTYKYVGFTGSNGTIQMRLGFQVYLEK